ncbi:MAG: GLPGLI family protein [Myroides sp.]|jgi:GLPGLI family protein|nr:GLPGLI family protein [Myroides sp.]
MIKNLVLALLITTTTALAQEQKKIQVTRYNYTLTTVAEIHKSDQTSTVEAILDINGDQSRFMNYNRYHLMESKINPNNSKEKKLEIAHNFGKGFNWIVYTDNAKTYFYSTIGDLKSFYSEDKNTIKWTILPEVKQWNDYKVQEATTTYGGREWTVLFTQEIPLQSGPYKFVNLPGLVVKAWDSENHYTFELLHSQKAETIWDIVELEKYEQISKDQVNKARHIDANKTYEQSLSEKGITIQNGPPELKAKKKTVQNPIERDF